MIEKSRLIGRELSVLISDMTSVQEIAATLPDFCPDAREHCIEC